MTLLRELGRALRPVRPGLGAAATARLAASGSPSFTIGSAAFTDGSTIPTRFTADGAAISPPLHWLGLPPGTASLALLVEDVDAPFPRPLVHLLLHGLPPTLNGLAEDAIPRSMAQSRMFTAGRNSYGRRGYLAPSPVPGHGPHRYIFQLLALAEPFHARRIAGRGALLNHVRRHLVGHSRFTGVYER